MNIFKYLKWKIGSMKNVKNWKRLSMLAKKLRKACPKLGVIAVDYVDDLYHRWNLYG